MIWSIGALTDVPKITLPCRRVQTLTFAAVFMLTGCVNHQFGQKSNLQKECVSNLVNSKNVKAKIESFFEHSFISIDECPESNWDFRFLNSEVGREYFEYIKTQPENEKIEISVFVEIKSVSDSEIIISKLKLS